MRNLKKELEEFELSEYQINEILKWANTLTNQDLFDNGSQNACFIPGENDYSDEIVKSAPSDIIQSWIEIHIDEYRLQEAGKIFLMKTLRENFNISLVECRSFIDKNW